MVWSTAVKKGCLGQLGSLASVGDSWRHLRSEASLQYVDLIERESLETRGRDPATRRRPASRTTARWRLPVVTSPAAISTPAHTMHIIHEHALDLHERSSGGDGRMAGTPRTRGSRRAWSYRRVLLIVPSGRPVLVNVTPHHASNRGYCDAHVNWSRSVPGLRDTGCLRSNRDAGNAPGIVSASNGCRSTGNGLQCSGTQMSGGGRVWRQRCLRRDSCSWRTRDPAGSQQSFDD